MTPKGPPTNRIATENTRAAGWRGEGALGRTPDGCHLDHAGQLTGAAVLGELDADRGRSVGRGRRRR